MDDKNPFQKGCEALTALKGDRYMGRQHADNLRAIAAAMDYERSKANQAQMERDALAEALQYAEVALEASKELIRQQNQMIVDLQGALP